MSSSCPSVGSTEHPSWRELYLLALFEVDKHKASALIVEAERALVLRERELFGRPQHAAERDAINTALHSLEALKICVSGDRHVTAA